MRRVLAAVAVAGLAFAGCGGSGGPKPFPGSALDKATELIRRADVAGLQHADAATIAGVYGTTGTAACHWKNAQARKDAQALSDAVNPQFANLIDPRFTEIVLEVYCPRLL